MANRSAHLTTISDSVGALAADCFGLPGRDLLDRRLLQLAAENERVKHQLLFACEALKLPWKSKGRHSEAIPFSAEWYDQIEHYRYDRKAPWLPRLMGFCKHAGERLVAVGCGLGSDWLQFGRGGAVVSVCLPNTDHLEVVKRYFRLRRIPVKCHQCEPTSLPFSASSADVVCISGLPSWENLEAVLDEAFRVLKPGGKVIAMLPSRYRLLAGPDVTKRIWDGLRRGGVLRHLTGYSSHQVKRLFSGYEELVIKKRYLCRGEIPHLLRAFPQGVWERLFGRVLVVRAFKPIRAFEQLRAAA